jgi:hypothetical protein
VTPLAEAAAFLAQSWPVFPCDAQKRPLTTRGLYDATRDPDQARRMFQHPATVLIGVPMGEDVGLFTVDLDTKRGAPGMEWLAANASRLPRTRTHSTPSGGRHLLFRWPSGRALRNSASKIAPGVDVRAAGGYVCVPPSPSYAITDDAMPAEAPAWLLDLIDPPAPPPRAPEPYVPPSRADRATRYAEAALDAECAAVARAAEGGRNDQLNTSAFALGTLIGAGALSESTARDELRRAALHAGLDPRETALTIESGITAGKQHPREIPERAGAGASGTTHTAPSAPVAGSGPPLTDTPRKPVIWIDGDTWDAAAIPKRPWLAPGYLLRGSVSVLSGQGAGGKSSLVVAWTLSAAAGTPIGGFAPVEPLRVVNYNTEDDREEQQRRYSAALTASKTDPATMRRVVRCGPTDVGTLFERNADTGRVGPTEAMDALELLCTSAGADLLVCDPLAELHNAEENDNTAMRAVVAAFRSFAKRLNIAVLILHHDRKGNSTPGDMDRMRGASSLGGAVRVALTLTTMTAEEADKLGVQPDQRRRHFRVDGAKSNYAPPSDAEWWRISGEEIPNGEQVAAVMPWEPPTPFGGLTATDCSDVMHQMDRGTVNGHAYAATKQAGADWAGHLLINKHKKTPKQAEAILAAWTENGLIAVEDLDGPRRGHPRKAFSVNLAAVAEMKAQFKGGNPEE